MYDFGFIGCGHMGSELVRVAARSGKSVACADYDAERARSLAREIAGKEMTAAEICKECRFIVLGVRPQNLAELAEEIRPLLLERKERFVLITMLAGKKIGTVLDTIGISAPVIRIMPNTPVRLGAGVILYTPDAQVTDEEVSLFEEAFAPAGSLIRVEEPGLDSGCVISGSGPAFVYKFIQAYAAAGCKIGFDQETAVRLACETLIGASKMVLETGKSPETLCSEVCSKGGTTERGVLKIEDSDFDHIIMEAVEASYKRTLELGK